MWLLFLLLEFKRRAFDTNPFPILDQLRGNVMHHNLHRLNHLLCEDFIKFPLQTRFHRVRKDKAWEVANISVTFNLFIFVNYPK